jgi:hypothetical protein
MAAGTQDIAEASQLRFRERVMHKRFYGKRLRVPSIGIRE